ncbi:MAG: hypothetical protein JNK82_05460 [Myxococcaceae bacterium]|nr:hypothetical protein [Myxococcaceae bacterium]
MQIEYVTHASLKLTGRKTLLLDPFYFFDPTAAEWMCHYRTSLRGPSSRALRCRGFSPATRR